MTETPDLSRLSGQDLLRLESAIVAELRARQLVRTNNKPIGDIAEAVVLRARGGTLEPNSTKSHDILSAAGVRIQVKAMGERAAGNNAVFSPFRSTDFDTAVLLVFDGEFDLVEAYEASAAEVIAMSRFSAHVNGYLAPLRAVRAAGVDDVSAEMRSAWSAVSAHGQQ